MAMVRNFCQNKDYIFVSRLQKFLLSTHPSFLDRLARIDKKTEENAAEPPKPPELQRGSIRLVPSQRLQDHECSGPRLKRKAASFFSTWEQDKKAKKQAMEVKENEVLVHILNIYF